ncbi:TetR/AcrR family transcriptional regulator [Phenylobacterium montanum]|uniref:TetR family transcriptional regulator n=1 Tax=Phenylobacterium montanum TaxID=2823693 RepID=A0A975FWA1_9CAUL|nr:TetR family transcriptional regulator [Caulobacter sp. S6]QUD86316.1 TetR family transcriptional regulator [Caulobacter sp. S6]
MNHRPAYAVAAFNDAPPTRRALAKQRTRQRLLEAARRLFAERGYEAATVRDIAAAADLSTGAVFASFADKAELFTEVIVSDYEQLAERMDALDLEALPAREALMSIFAIAYQNQIEQLGLIQAAISFSWQRDHTAELRSRQGMKLLTALISAVLQRGVQSGELSDRLDVRLTTEMLWDCYMANYRRAIFDHWDAKALCERLSAQIDLMLAGFRAAA